MSSRQWLIVTFLYFRFTVRFLERGGDNVFHLDSTGRPVAAQQQSIISSISPHMAPTLKVS